MQASSYSIQANKIRMLVSTMPWKNGNNGKKWNSYQETTMEISEILWKRAPMGEDIDIAMKKSSCKMPQGAMDDDEVRFWPERKKS